MVAYSYTGTIKTFIVPTTGKYDISAFGGSGGANVSINGAAGGSGAELEAEFNLTKGETLKIVVGGYGGNGYAGGGGGGGASEVLADIGPNGTFVPILVAGGGGGAGYNGTNGNFAGHAATIVAPGNGSGGAAGAGFGGAGGAGAKANGANGNGFNHPQGGGDYANGAFPGYGSDGGAGGFGGGGGANFGGGGGGGYTGGTAGAGSYSSKTHKGMGSGGYGGTSYVASSGKLILSSATHTGDGEVDIDLACFVTGTMIRAMRGRKAEDVAVEALRVGDLVVTASGARRPIRWIGHRELDLRHPRRHNANPIRIAAHAFGTGFPVRDLYLSPGHPVLVGADEETDGHLVPIVCLVNGTTVRRVTVEAVTYWHVELDRHDILLAEGLPAESYLDWGDRPFFTECAAHALANPDFIVPGLGGRCRPVAVEGRIVEAERRRLDIVFSTRLSEACAWPGTSLAALGA